MTKRLFPVKRETYLKKGCIFDVFNNRLNIISGNYLDNNSGEVFL